MFHNIVNFMGRGFYEADKLRADESKGTQEGRVMATKKLKKSFSHHAPSRLSESKQRRRCGPDCHSPFCPVCAMTPMSARPFAEH